MNIEDLPKSISSKIKIVGSHWIQVGAVYDAKRSHLQPAVRFMGKIRHANRVMLHLGTGFDLESELQANHKPECNINLCINPDHLYVGTQKENVDDIVRITKTHCKFGHELSTSPTTGHKYCQVCKNKRRDEWRRKYE